MIYNNDSRFIYLNPTDFSIKRVNEKELLPSQDDLTFRDLLRTAFRNGPLGLDDIDAEIFIDIVLDYQKNPKSSYYNRLPKPIKDQVDGIWFKQNRSRQKPMNKDLITNHILYNITKDDMFNQIITGLNNEMNNEVIKIRKELKESITKAYDDLFDKIEEIRKEDPERADRIQAIKDSTDKAKNFNVQLEYLLKDKPRNVRRYHQHYNSDITEFDKKANTTNINIPKLDKLYPILKAYLPKKYNNADDIKGFIVLLARSIMDMDLTYLPNIAYAYRLIDSIYITAIYKGKLPEDCNVYEEIEKIMHNMESIKLSKTKTTK